MRTLKTQREQIRNRLVVVFQKLLVAGSALYLTLLIITVGALRFIGEAWWVTCALLYLPRFAFGFPILIFTPGLLFLKRVKWLWTQLASLIIVLWPLMGLRLNLFHSQLWQHQEHLRIVSMNVNSGRERQTELIASLLQNTPDILVLVEVASDIAVFETLLAKRFAHVMRSTEFVIASRFPLIEERKPERLKFNDRERSPRYVTYKIRTNLGPIVLYCLHPISPRPAFYKLRGKGFRREILAGNFGFSGRSDELKLNTALRQLQISNALREADAETAPVVLVGDTNLPGLSRILAEEFSKYTDAFDDVGIGFGYTFPRRLPWMRIDRVLTSNELKPVSISVSCTGTSDHFCIVADLVRR
jgi:endonuclease/exonuclease/phosphatase (EEP) superfamily protein YafD